MSLVFEKPIAILGGGATAQTFAADLTLAGCKVRLYELPELAPITLGEVLETHQIELLGEQLNFKWFRRTGIAKIDLITTNISEAIKGAGLIIVSLPAIGHKVFFDKMIPHLEDGQVISIFTDNYGSLVLREMMRQKGCDVKVTIGGWSSMPYGTRLIKPGKVNLHLGIYRLMYDALPSKDRDKFYNAIKDLPAFDRVSRIEPGDTVVGVSFSNPNPVVHVPGSVLNVGAMEVSQIEGILNIPKDKYSMYKHGMSPAVARVQLAFYREIREIANAMGIKIVEYKEENFFRKGSVMIEEEYLSPFYEVKDVIAIEGPLSVEHRYFTEDIGVGAVAYYNFAKKFGVKVPIIEAFIRIGSVICQKDFFKEGISLRDMGLEDLTKEQILKYLREGIRP